MFESKKARARAILFSFISIMLIPLFLVPASYLIDDEIGIISGDGKGIDIAPSITLSSDTQHTTMIATLTAVATDVGDNAGIQWIQIYQDNVMIDQKNCNLMTTCTFVKVINEPNQAVHTYYAKTKDKGNNVKDSSTVTIIFDGFNQDPIITAYNPVSSTPIMNENSQLDFSVSAYDPNNDPINYLWKIDGNNVSITDSFTYNADYFSAGNHIVYVIVYDNKGGTAVRTWNVTVNNVLIPTQCDLTFNPLSPQVYGVAVTASCSCISTIGPITETTAILERNGNDVTITENNFATILEAGLHNYRCYVVETPNFASAEILDTYLINQANPNAHLALNGIENDLSIVYGIESNATGWVETTQATANAILYRNGINVAMGSPATEILTLGVGVYNYTYHYPQSQNYSEAIVTRFLTVSQYDSTCSLTLNPNPAVYGTATTASCSCTNPEASAMLWRDGIDVTSENNIAVILGAGNYNYVCNVSATQNYTGASVSDVLTIFRQNSSIQLLLNNTDGDINATTTDLIPVFANLINPITGDIIVYNNSIEIYNGASPYSDVLIFPDAGIYNITAYYPENQNYTESFATHFVIVETANSAPIVNLISPVNNTIYENQQDISFNFIATDDLDNSFNCILYLDDIANQTVLTTNDTLQIINVNGISYGNHSWRVECTDSLSATGISETWFFAIRLHDIGILDSYVNSTNGIRIRYFNGTDIISNPAVLVAGENYTIQVRVNNYGTQPEAVNTTFNLENSTNNFFLGYDYDDVVNSYYYADAQLVNTENYNGFYNISVNTTIIGFDDANLSNNFRQRTVYFGIVDSEAPNWSNEFVIPTSGNVYGNGPYLFSIDWQDNIAVTNVVFEFENVNYTPVCTPNLPAQITTCTYTINDLAAGNYNYIWYANDEMLNQNSTGILAYAVLIYPSVCILDVAPASPQIYGTAITPTCSCTNPEENSILTIDGNIAINNTPVILSAGTHLINCSVGETQNYSGASQSLDYLILQADPTTLMHIAINGTESDQTYDYPIATNVSAWNTILGQSGLNFDLYRNDLLTTNPEILELSAGIYNYIYNMSGNENYTSGSITRILTINQATTILTLFAPNWTIYEGTVANVSCSANNNEVVVELFRNGILVSNPDLTVLPIGNYTYVCNTSGSQNYTSASVSNILEVIPKLPGEVHLYLNGIENNITINYPTAVNATGTTPYGYVSIFRNGTLIANGTSPQTDISNLAVGYYQYMAFSSGDESHYNATINYYATINPAISTCSLTLNPNPAVYGTATTASCSCTNPEASAMLWREGIDVTSENNIAVILGAGNYNYVCNVSATQNYTGASVSDVLIVNRANPNAHLALNGIESDLSIVYGTESNATGWVETTQATANAILYRNGINVAMGSPATEILTLGVGVYNYTYHYPQSQNYTGATITRILTVSQQPTDLTLTILPSNIIYDGTQSNVSCNASNSIVTIQLWRNNVLITSGNGYVQEINILPVGNYTYVCNTSGNQNYSANSVSGLLQVLPKEPGIIELYLNGIPADLNIEYLNNPVNATAISALNNITLYRNGTLIGQGADFVTDISTLAVGYYVYYANSSGNASHYPANITRYVLINRSSPQLIIDMLPSDNVTYGQQTTTTCNITNTNEINNLLNLYRRLYNWTNTTTSVSNPDIQTLAGGAYNYICNVSESQNFTSAYAERVLTVNRADSSVILLLDGNNSNITRIEGNVINHTGIVTLYSLPNIVDVTINIYDYLGTEEGTSTGTSPHTYLYNYTFPGLYRVDAVFLGNENYTGSGATHYANITPVIHDSNILNITYNKSNSTVYWNDNVLVTSYIRNEGNVPDTINVTLSDNGNVVAWQIVNNLFANETVHETRQINFTWNANNADSNGGWRTVTVTALPLFGETDLSDNQKSFNARVWLVCDVIDCNEFDPRTASKTYTLGTPFNATVAIANKWNTIQFYDLRLEMPSTTGLNVSPPQIVYINLAPGEVAGRRWLVNGTDYGTFRLTSYAGNREYAGNKSITINQNVK